MKLNLSSYRRSSGYRYFFSSIQEISDEPLAKVPQTFSPRSYHRVIKVARTIADLDNSDDITTPHVLEALQYRVKL